MRTLVADKDAGMDLKKLLKSPSFEDLKRLEPRDIGY